MIGKYCVVRTYSAGVHVGVVQSIDGTAVALTDARRIWRWEGAHTLHEVSLNGVSPASKVSEPTSSILLTEAIEVIPTTEVAEKNLRAAKWAR